MYVPALALIALPTLALAVVRFVQPLPEPFAEYKHTVYWYRAAPYEAYDTIMSYSRFVESIKEIPGVVPENGCIYSVKPAIVSLYSNRLSIPPPREATSDLEFYESLGMANCQYFHLAALVSPSYSTPYYPAERLRGSLKVLRATYFPGSRDRYVALLAELIRK